MVSEWGWYTVTLLGFAILLDYQVMVSEWSWSTCRAVCVWDPARCHPMIELQKGAIWVANRWYWLFSAATVGCWTPLIPVSMKISADKHPLNQLPVENLFVSAVIFKTCYHYQRICHKNIILSVYIKGNILTLYIIFVRVPRFNLHDRASIIRC